MVEQGELLPVIQDDREAAADAMEACYMSSDFVRGEVRSGATGHLLVQAFAAHRLRHSTDFERGLEAGAVEQAAETLLTEFAVVTGQPERSLAELPEEERGQWVACVGKCISAYLAALIPPVKP